ncbi:uncharacterized protein LOC141687147 [Apium graveolens]|uniref:uncharacterized protein LOC141687147 n=1 Tax=Apium graveolens TaxID=4045 RepID=UPI003D7A988B
MEMVRRSLKFDGLISVDAVGRSGGLELLWKHNEHVPLKSLSHSHIDVEVEGFNDALADTGLIDMDLVGHQFTWERGRGTTTWTEIRLDRTLTTVAWLNMFPTGKLYNLEGSFSDHSPILLIPEASKKFTVQRKFRFENAWLTEPMCAQLVLESWQMRANTTARKSSNQISRLKNAEGTWVDWDDGLVDHIMQHYQHLFAATHVNWSEVTEDEVKSALFQMDPNKAPGPDGMKPAFYRKYWAIVGHDVVELVIMFMQEGMLPEGLNDTNVVLIPKKKCPATVGDFRPISLCNVLVKIITKVMENRM